MSAWADWVMAVATIAMSITGWLSYDLAKRVQDKSEKQQKYFSDLLEAIVISNLLAGSEDTGDDSKRRESGIEKFKKLYKGETPIFKP